MDIGLMLMLFGAFVILMLFCVVFSMAFEDESNKGDNSHLERIRALQEFEYMRNARNYGKENFKKR